jgi:FdhD protein
MDAEVLAGISAPTSLAIEEAASSGLTLVGLVRRDGLVVYAHAERITDAA